MDITTLKSKIVSNTLPNFLIFAGDEWEVQKIYINQICKVTGMEQRRIDSFRDIAKTLRGKSFVNQSCVYIVRDDKDLITNEKLWTEIEDRLGDNILILLITKLDKRVKFYTRNKGTIIEFDALPPTVLRKYIKRQITVNDSHCDKLIEVCENNYGRILLEIDKIKDYTAGMDYTIDDKIYNHVIDELIHKGTIYHPPKDAIFDLVDMILCREPKLSFKLLKESYDSGEATMVMLSVLFNNAKAVLQVQECRNKEVGKTTGLTGWQIMNAKKCVGHYTEEELIDMLHLIRQIESGIKTGKIEDKFAMEYLLTSIL